MTFKGHLLFLITIFEIELQYGVVCRSYCFFSAFFSNSGFRGSIAFEILCGGTWKDSLEISRIDEKTFFTKQETLQPSYNVE